MANPDRPETHLVELLEQLQREPYAFDFYQAIRLLDCAYPSKPQTGRGVAPKYEPLRLSQEPSAAFAPSTLAGLEPGDRDQPHRLEQRFFGLLGPQGPLPLHLTDFAQSRVIHQKDYTFCRFLDTFHHRMISLIYLAWARVRPTVNFDRGSRDRFGEYVSSLFGLGMPSLEDRDSLPDLAKRHFAGLMSCQTKHAEGLLAILRGYFCLPVELEQFVGQWIDLPNDCRCYLGSSPTVSVLGKTVTVGSQIWDCQQKFRVILGPLSLAEFYHFLPGIAEEVPAELHDQDQTVPTEADRETNVPTYPVADTIYHNGNFYTVNPQQPWADAIAVKDGRIARVGKFIDVLPCQGPETQVIDLEGASVLPGLHVAYCDPIRIGIGRPSAVVKFSSSATWEEASSEIRRAASDASGDEWIIGGSWGPSLFGGEPDKRLLDQLVPDRPALILDEDEDAAWVNSNALAAAGITKETSDPPQGRIGRDASTGQPTGALYGSAVRIVRQAVPQLDRARKVNALRQGCDALHRLGITSLETATVSRSDLIAYKTLEDQNKLQVQIAAGFGWKDPRIDESYDDATTLREIRDQFQSLHVNPSFVRIRLDGVLPLKADQPAAGGRPDAAGTNLFYRDRAEIDQDITRLDRCGLSVTLIAKGAVATAAAHDAVRTASRDRPRASCHAVEECASASRAVSGWTGSVRTMPSQGAKLARDAKETNATQPGSAPTDKDLTGFVTGRTESASWEPPNPWMMMERLASGEKVDASEPSEGSLDLAAAVAMLTIDAAHSTGQDELLGSIEEGKLANLVAVDHDFRRSIELNRANGLGAAKVLRTIFEGQTVFQQPASEDSTMIDAEPLSQTIQDHPSLGGADAAQGSSLPAPSSGSQSSSPLPAGLGATASTRPPGGTRPESSAEPPKSSSAGPPDSLSRAARNASLDSLIALVRGYVGDELEWDVRLILDRRETPPVGLGIHGHLGWSSWLMSDPLKTDPADLILDAMISRFDASGAALPYRVVSDWDHRTIAQFRDGSRLRDSRMRNHATGSSLPAPSPVED